MGNTQTLLWIQFDNSIQERDVFLGNTRRTVVNFMNEKMRLDALIHEIAKNIYDHAGGRGTLRIEKEANKFDFCIKDEGVEAFDREFCKNHSRLAGNGINFGIGLKLIEDLAMILHIDLVVNISSGFSYSGIYIQEKRS